MHEIKNDFPVLHQNIGDKPLVYLDSAATMQKPQAVIDAMSDYYEKHNSNVHRGLHTLSARATALYESARSNIANFINAKKVEEIVFVKGTTEGINLIAHSYAMPNLQAGDEIIISHIEHHSNIVPWQMVCERTGAILKVIDVDDDGVLDQAHYASLFNAKTKLVATIQVSNAIGTINPVKEMIALAHNHDVPVLIDGAQAVQHMPVDVQALDCDFYVFSSHKCYGPTGLGVLYAKEALLDEMIPYQTGGEMIKQVTFERSTFNVLPHKFEAGTPHIAGACGFSAAIDYIKSVGFERIQSIESELLSYATAQLTDIAGLRIIGQAPHKASIISFVLDDIHAHDVGTILDTEGVAVRAGHHCAMPLMDRFGVPATARASFAAYNTKQDVDTLVDALLKVKRLFHA